MRGIRLPAGARRAVFASCMIGAMLAIAAPASALTPYPANRAVELPRSGWTVHASGPIAGWYWMRSATYSDSATWTFNNFDPAALTGDHKVSLFLAPLVTNKADGGAGWGTRVHVTVTYTYSGGSKTWTNHVTLTNPFPFRSSLDSGGVGYQTYGRQTLTQSQFKHGVGTLKVTLTRDSSSSTYGFHPHVAVAAGAVSVWYLAS